MPFLGVSERVDFTPWHGWEMSQAGGDGRLGPIVTPAGPAEIVVASGVMTLAIAGRAVIATSAERLRHIHIGDKTIRLAAHRPKAGDWVAFPGLASTEVTLATIGGRASLPRARADGVLALDIPAAETEVAVDLLLRRGAGAGR
jgi:putative isomerase